MLMRFADTSCYNWLIESGNPFRGRSFGLEAIVCEKDHAPWRQYFTRAHSRIYTSHSDELIDENLNDVGECSLSAFQEVWAVLIIAMTDYGVKNLDPTGVVLQSPRGVFNHRGSFCFSGAIALDI